MGWGPARNALFKLFGPLIASTGDQLWETRQDSHRLRPIDGHLKLKPVKDVGTSKHSKLHTFIPCGA